ncbi:MAG: DUF3368 domain-containing protein [Bacteroidales bacterium]|nr:DUF3368 domain-containing protein [Bacteroidales bacterium]
MPKIIISDTTVLILLKNIDQLDLLKGIYGDVITTPEVAEEFGEKLPDWIKIQSVSDKKYQDFIETQLDKGEASAFALAKENDDVLLLLDDLKARKLALKLNLKFTGTLGIIHKAKQTGLIKKVKPLIEKILSTNFRISDKIIDEILRLNEEDR